MKNYIIFKTFLFCGLLLPVMVQAQVGTNSIMHPAAIELTQAKSLWFNTNNAAGLGITPLNDYSEASAKYVFDKGEYKLQQQGKTENDVQFNSNGALRLGGVSLWGNFTFSNITTKDSRFNTMQFQPLRDMPYYVADSVSSGWKKQLYDLSLKAATPMYWNRLGLGCELDYTSATGAKQNDPRSTAYYYSISARPGLVFKINDKNHIGINGLYENMFERTIPTNSNSQLSQPVYIMRGLGNYGPGVVGGLGGITTFYYKSDKVGGAVQYGYHSNIDLLLDLKYYYKVEDVFQAPSKPQRMGSTVQNYLNGNLQLLINGRYTSKVTLDYFDKQTDGIEYIQVIDNSYEVQKWVTVQKYIRSNYTCKGASLKYDLFSGKEKEYTWRAGVTGEYSDLADVYYLPRSEFKAENIYASVYAKKNISFGTNNSFLLGCNLGYNSNLSGKFVYTGADPTSVIIRDFYNKDLAYLTSDYYRAGLSFSYSVAVKNSSNAIFVSGDCQYLKPAKGSENRINTVFSLGFTF